MSIIPLQTPPFHSEHLDTEEDALLRRFSRCPSCQGGFSSALILPCSHPMCGGCVEAGGARVGSQTAAERGLGSCPVPCPVCRLPVELPCRTWTSAVSCLPEYPELSSGRTPERREEASAREQNSNRHRSCSSSISPADGDVDLLDEEMKQSVHGLHFALDSSHIPSCVNLSGSSMTATYTAKSQPPGPASKASVAAMALLSGDIVIRQGQYYWEVDVYNSSLYRIGVRSRDSSRTWCFERRGGSFSAVYDGRVEHVYSVPPGVKTVGLFLNITGGVLSFHNALCREHLVTLPTRFGPGGVVPAFALGQGRLKIRTGLSPDPLVFHCKDSGYRGTRGTEGGVWRRGVAFGSVRKVVEKFEGLVLSQ